ncbi:MAG: hypothetical protein NPMRTH1_270028 [Nitrosopumilales archaeon]|nr:MAG: hypothetical protein NPMRTH1_270028 [Nitrosopumilales archaeon]
MDKEKPVGTLPKGWKENVDAIKKDSLSPKEKRILREGTERIKRITRAIKD